MLSKAALHPVVEAELLLDRIEETTDGQADASISDAGFPVYQGEFVRMRERMRV